MLRSQVFPILLCLLPGFAYAGLDDHRNLEGQLVLEVGDLEKLHCPVHRNYDCLTWPVDLYKMGARCLRLHGYFGGLGGLGLLTVDKNKAVSAFVIDKGSRSLSIEQYQVTIYTCPEMS